MLTQHFTMNTKGNDYFVGDIHGCYTMFMNQLRKLNFDFENDRVFSVGDLVDRGPESNIAIHLPKALWFHAVRGNHEDFVLGSHTDHVWYYNGGNWATGYNTDELNDFRKIVLDNMPLTITVDTYLGKIGLVHAESEDDWNDNSDASAQKNMWARTRIKHGPHTNIKNIDMVVVGHTPLKEVVRSGNVLYIDTGAVFNNNLTILDIYDVFNGVFKTL